MRRRGEERRKEEMDGAIQGGNSTKALSEKSVEAGDLLNVGKCSLRESGGKGEGRQSSIGKRQNKEEEEGPGCNYLMAARKEEEEEEEEALAVESGRGGFLYK